MRSLLVRTFNPIGSRVFFFCFIRYQKTMLCFDLRYTSTVIGALLKGTVSTAAEAASLVWFYDSDVTWWIRPAPAYRFLISELLPSIVCLCCLHASSVTLGEQHRRLTPRSCPVFSWRVTRWTLSLQSRLSLLSVYVVFGCPFQRSVRGL